MARKVEPTHRVSHSGPYGDYVKKHDRAARHGWRSVGFCVVGGKRYVEMVHVRRGSGYENNKYFTIGISITTGEIMSPYGARD